MSNVLQDSIAPRLGILSAVFGVLVLSGCASGAGTMSSTATSSTSQTAPVVTTTSLAKPPPQRRSRSHRPPPASATSRGSGSLVYSTASNDVVQAQHAPGSCHANGSGLYSRPDPACTPGALNPAVTQATIDRTICVEGWTDTVRPPEAVSEQEKAASMAAYGDTGSTESYEYDHFVPLELGGATNDPRNLWPEPGASPNPKDAVEDDLREKVCDGEMTLAQAQRAIATNWVALSGSVSPPAPRNPPTTHSATSSSAPSTTGSAQCRLNASYSSRYDDYDVYVHSNQPDQSVTVTDNYGHSDSWHTDGSGYADVYFKSGGYVPGRRITAHVGGAICSTNL